MPDSCLTAACFDVTLLPTLLTLLIFLRTILDLVVSAATAVAQLALGAIRNRMVGFAAIEAALLARGTLFLAFLLRATAANGFDMTLFTALCAIFILLGAVLKGMVGAAAALALLWFLAVRGNVADFAAVVTLPLPGLPLGFLRFGFLLAAFCSTSFLTAYFRDVPNLAAVRALLILEFAVGLGVVILATNCAGLATFLSTSSTPFLTAYFRNVPDLAAV